MKLSKVKVNDGQGGWSPTARPEQIVVVHWNGQDGVASGPYCDTWDRTFSSWSEAVDYATKLVANSDDGWCYRAAVMTAAEYWTLIRNEG